MHLHTHINKVLICQLEFDTFYYIVLLTETRPEVYLPLKFMPKLRFTCTTTGKFFDEEWNIFHVVSIKLECEFGLI